MPRRARLLMQPCGVCWLRYCCCRKRMLLPLPRKILPFTFIWSSSLRQHSLTQLPSPNVHRAAGRNPLSHDVQHDQRHANMVLRTHQPLPHSQLLTLYRATPVRPDKLGESLEAYAKAAQTLHMLRLCHRFGQGPDVHVTKIPAEIELAIEALVIAAAKRQASCPWDNWSSSFSHFEGNCAPMDHIPDCYSPLSDALDGGVPLCETCEESYVDTETCEKACKTGDPELCWTCTQKVDHSNCMDTCDAEMTPEMNGLAMGWGYDDMDDCGEWRKRIDTKGNFAKYAKVSMSNALESIIYQDLLSYPGLAPSFRHRRTLPRDEDCKGGQPIVATTYQPSLPQPRRAEDYPLLSCPRTAPRAGKDIRIQRYSTGVRWS